MSAITYHIVASCKRDVISQSVESVSAIALAHQCAYNYVEMQFNTNTTQCMFLPLASIIIV